MYFVVAFTAIKNPTQLGGIWVGPGRNPLEECKIY
jgi:hypothetical protein